MSELRRAQNSHFVLSIFRLRELVSASSTARLRWQTAIARMHHQLARPARAKAGESLP